MSPTTENSNLNNPLGEKEKFTKSDYLKLVKAGFNVSLILSLIGCASKDISAKNLKPSPNPEAPTTTSDAAPEETGLPDGIEEVEVEAVPTPTEMVMPTEIVPEYTVTPGIENFRRSYIPVEELQDGSYWNWLNDVVALTLLDEFKAREDKIKDIEIDRIGIPIGIDSNGEMLSGAAFIYDTKTRPNFDDPETAPFKRDVTFGFTTWTESDGSTVSYRVVPVFYYDKKTQQVYPVITLNKIHNEGAIEAVNEIFNEDLNIPLIIYTQTTGEFVKDNIVMEDPIVGPFYDRLGKDEIWDRILRFGGGDVSAFSGSDMVFLSSIAKSNFFK